jgi:hypothetical protein
MLARLHQDHRQDLLHLSQRAFALAGKAFSPPGLTISFRLAIANARISRPEPALDKVAPPAHQALAGEARQAWNESV